MENNTTATTTKCFACDRPVGKSPKMADTRDAQVVYVGSDCYRKIKEAGRDGYQPPKGGPRLWLVDCECPSECDCQSPETSPALVSDECPIHNWNPSPSLTCSIHGEIQPTSPRLFKAAQAALPILKTYIEEVGGCDHSVGICCCDVIEACENLAASLAALNAPARDAGTCE